MQSQNRAILGDLRRQGEKLVTSESYGAPLPDPPAGLVWQRNADKTWSLLSVAAESGPKESSRDLTGASGEKYHRVKAEDTLQGLCLQYACSALELRRLNTLSGDTASVQAIKMLRIPNVQKSSTHKASASTTTTKKDQWTALEREEEKKRIVTEFIEETGEGEEEARFYLQERHFRLELALADWKNDGEAAAADMHGEAKGWRA